MTVIQKTLKLLKYQLVCSDGMMINWYVVMARLHLMGGNCINETYFNKLLCRPMPCLTY